ncbi:MAG: hypothetical protein LBP59_05695, partial [Planctomycetaceae bacterium]|nr:hypothetical protein [Planctomycetaceae bacterium]
NWTLNDHLNTIRDIIKPDGNVASHLEYNAFGKLISETKNDSLLFAYTGKLFDAVNMTTIPGWESTTLPPNVRSASHAIKTSSLEIIYPTKRYKGVTEKLFYKSDGSVTTHGEIGQGWALPTSVWDNSVINWMKEQAIAKKVPVKP